MRRFRAIPVVLLILCCGLPTAYPQGRGRRPMTEPLRTEATIQGVTPRVLHVVTIDGAQWLVSVPNSAERVVFQGTAEPAWLQTGMWVRFNATLTSDKRRKEYAALQPVNELTVITIRPGIEPGVFPENANAGRDALLNGDEENEKEEAKESEREKEGEKEREKERGKDGVREKERERERENDDQSARKTRIRGEVPEVYCSVVGRLIEFKDNKMRVAVGRIPVVAELSATAEVSLQMNELTFVRAGDKVDVNARVAPGQPGRAEGQELTITAAKPLTAEDWPSKGRRRTARGKKSDDSESEKQDRGKGKDKGDGARDGLR